MKTINYYRVSTNRQAASGLGLEAQRREVEDFCRSRGAEVIAEFTEAESGKNSARPQLRAAMDLAKITGATLVVAKVDRLARNAAFLNTILDSSLKVAFADMPDADRMVIGIMAQLAQWEAEQISKRTKAALQASKERGKKLGGDRGNLPSASAQGRVESARVRKAKAAERVALVGPYVARARDEGHKTLAAIAAYLNDKHINAPRGGQWQAAQVARVLEAL